MHEVEHGARAEPRHTVDGHAGPQAREAPQGEGRPNLQTGGHGIPPNRALTYNGFRRDGETLQKTRSSVSDASGRSYGTFSRREHSFQWCHTTLIGSYKRGLQAVFRDLSDLPVCCPDVALATCTDRGSPPTTPNRASREKGVGAGTDCTWRAQGTVQCAQLSVDVCII